MSTVKAINFQHPSASAANITLASDGTVSGGIPSPNRNLLYNGAMQVAQRGTSVTGLTTGGYQTADRWIWSINSQGTWTQDIQNDAPTGSGLRKSFRVLCTTADASPAAADQLLFQQALEGQDLQRIAKGTSSAQQLTLSFWVKSNVTGTYIAELYDNDNTRQVSASYTISASATWEKKTITFPADTTGAFDNDNAASLYVNLWLGGGSTYTSGTLNTVWAAATNANRGVGQTNLAAATNNYWQVTGVQLEVGSQATAFEFKSFGQELRECQRYYWRSSSDASSLSVRFSEYCPGFTATSLYVSLRNPVPMRVKASSVDYANVSIVDGTAFTSLSSIALVSDSTNLINVVNVVSTGMTANRPYALATNNTSSGYLGLSAEL
jgi:hypothetical protein